MAELVALLDAKGVTMPAELRNEQDLLAVLRWAAESSAHNVTAALKEALCAGSSRTARRQRLNAHALRDVR
ncbi:MULTISPECIES: hypothetical protein [unclassified Actinoplanes]|uniref:hypothetical protein n=1 Tax=unclassified Actinoplanes TaxID=2626549 RepID=UPI0012BAA9DD|nr:MULTISPECIES: hypothetical protein [unclassified Actinoplanes]